MAQPFNPFGQDFVIVNSPSEGKNGVVLDFDPSFRQVTGRQLLAQSLACRFSIARGSVIDCPNDGLDLRDMVSSGLTTSQINALPGAIRNEAQKDNRVQDAQVTVSFSLETSTLTIVMSVTSLYGPFTLTLAVTSVSVSILNANLPNAT